MSSRVSIPASPDFPQAERRRLLSDLVDGDLSFGDVSIKSPEKAHLLNRILDSPSVRALRGSPRRPFRSRQRLSVSKSPQRAQVRPEATSHSSNELRRVRSAPSLAPTTAAVKSPNPIARLKQGIVKPARLHSPRTSPRVRAAAAQSASRSVEHRAHSLSTRSLSSEASEGSTSEFTESESDFASDEFDTDDDTSQSRSMSPPRRSKTDLAGHSRPLLGPGSHYCRVLRSFTAEDSEELDIVRGQIVICRALEGEDGDDWVEAKKVPFTGASWKLIPSSVARQMSQSEVTNAFRDEMVDSSDTFNESDANDGDRSTSSIASRSTQSPSGHSSPDSASPFAKRISFASSAASPISEASESTADSFSVGHPESPGVGSTNSSFNTPRRADQNSPALQLRRRQKRLLQPRVAISPKNGHVNTDELVGPVNSNMAHAFVSMRWKEQLMWQAKAEFEKARAEAKLAEKDQHDSIHAHCKLFATNILQKFPFCGEAVRQLVSKYSPHMCTALKPKRISSTEDMDVTPARPRSLTVESVSDSSEADSNAKLAHKFLRCCARGSTDQLQTFLLAYPQMNIDVRADDSMPEKLENGATGLLLAVRGGHHAAVDFLLSHRANVGLSSDIGDSPLQAAARLGDASLFANILDHSDDVSVRSYEHRYNADRASGTSLIMVCDHQNPLLCLCENIAAKKFVASVRTTLIKATRTDTGSIFKRAISHHPKPAERTPSIPAQRHGAQDSDLLRHQKTPSPTDRERTQLLGALADKIEPFMNTLANNGLEVAVGLNLGLDYPNVAPLRGWVANKNGSLRDLLVEGSSLGAFGPRLRSRVWKTILGLLGPPITDTVQTTGPSQAEKFDKARLERYEGLCQQFKDGYEADLRRCRKLQRQGLDDSCDSVSIGTPVRADNGGGLSMTLRQIAVDLKRARKDFPVERLAALQRLLYVFAALHPSLGYVQGMHDIACVVYYQFHSERRRGNPTAHHHSGLAPSLNFTDSPRKDYSEGSLHDTELSGAPLPEVHSFSSPFVLRSAVPDACEASTFSVLNEVVGRCQLMQNLFQSKEYVDEFIRIFSTVLKSSDPDVAAHLGEQGPINGGGVALTPDHYIFPWIFTLFSQGVHYDAVWQIWDRIFTGWAPSDFQHSGGKNGGTKHRTKPSDSDPSPSLHPWHIGINPAYMVSICVALVYAVREPLLACREFSTAMDVLQNALVVLNGNSCCATSSPVENTGLVPSTLADTNLFMILFLKKASEIYEDHALPAFGKGTFLLRRDEVANAHRPPKSAAK